MRAATPRAAAKNPPLLYRGAAALVDLDVDDVDELAEEVLEVIEVTIAAVPVGVEVEVVLVEPVPSPAASQYWI
jgi:hypothetical protein